MNGIEGVKQITQEMILLLERIEPSVYRQSIDLFDGSSVGKHFRHIFDFYRCLSKAKDDQKVDYSSRERNPLIEEEPRFAADQFKSIIEKLDACVMQDDITVLSDFSTNDEEQREIYRSTFGREMAFIHDHAVHHLAIIKMGIKIADPHLTLEEHFGVAPSTVKFQQGK